MRPSADEVSVWFRRLRETNWKGLEERVLEALRRDEEPLMVDGYPSSTGSDGRGGAELTSVEAAAELLAFGTLPRDEHAQNVTVLLDMLHQCVMSRDAVKNRLDHIEARAIVGKPPAHEEAICVEEHCEDPAHPRKAGRCEACYQWRLRWSQRAGQPMSVAPIVPEAVITARKAERDKRRVHVSGPLAV